ncbi:MAG: heavy metal translocating P-type ATPase, partial [Bacteroidota bacterium]|nr:heavy metal translocating P-type ATPase [Bacteroidota bacterium]
MHPEVIRDAPGRCPKCGMDLVPVEAPEKHEGHAAGHHVHHPAAANGHDVHSDHVGHGGYDKHAGHHTHDFLKRFWVCLIVTIPILLLSHMIQTWLRFELRFPGDKYVLLLLSTFVYIYGGAPFLKGMIGEIKGKAIGMMTLVAIAITVAFIYSTAVVFGLKGMDFFWELATLIDIMLLGHWLEMRSQMAASKALESLVALLPSTVHIERAGAF